MRTRHDRIVLALFAARSWTKFDDDALAYLAEYRKVDSERHRTDCLREIARAEAMLVAQPGCDAYRPSRAIRLLRILRAKVQNARIGARWIDESTRREVLTRRFYRKGA